MEIPADENTPDIPDQDESETPEPSDSDIEETPSPEVPEETPDTDSTDEPPVEETPIPEESPLPDDEEAFSVSEAILEYGYAYAAANAESVIYEDADLTAPLFTDVTIPESFTGGDLEGLSSFEIRVTADAIQREPFTNAAEAFQAFDAAD